jgi:RsiW-degrading membrane proteinase PrsW (M82 family)
MEHFAVVVPPNFKSGDHFSVNVAGQVVQVCVPEGTAPGEQVIFTHPRQVRLVVNNESKKGYWNTVCCTKSSKFCAILLFSVIFFVCLGLAWQPLVLFAAIVPSVIIMETMRRLYKAHVTRCQMIITFFECILWMVCLTLVLYGMGESKVYPLYIAEKYESGDCSRCIGGYAFTSFITAGTLEEITKFLAIRRILYSSQVANPRAMWVYGVCAGAGFAAVENVMYVASGGAATAIMRAVSSVPLHCSTGFVMGTLFSASRFGTKKILSVVIIVPAILIHGLYDFALFTGDGVGGAASALMVIAVICLLGTVAWLRWYVLELEKRFPLVGDRSENIHELIESGIIPKLCNCCDCCY